MSDSPHSILLKLRLPGCRRRGAHRGSAARRATELDPLNPKAYETPQYKYYYTRRYEDSLAAATQGLELGRDISRALGPQGFTYIELHNYEAARGACAAEKMQWVSFTCLAIVYGPAGHEGGSVLRANQGRRRV